MTNFDIWYDTCMKLQDQIRLSLIEAERTIFLYKVEILEENITFYRIWDRAMPTLNGCKVSSQDTARKIYNKWLEGTDIGRVKGGESDGI